MGENDQVSLDEICMIQIVFPVQSDQVAMAVKAAIETALLHQQGVTLDFRLMKGRSKPPLG